LLDINPLIAAAQALTYPPIRRQAAAAAAIPSIASITSIAMSVSRRLTSPPKRRNQEALMLATRGDSNTADLYLLAHVSSVQSTAIPMPIDGPSGLTIGRIMAVATAPKSDRPN